MQTKWNLKLFYSSPSDPKIEKDIKAVEKDYQSFVSKYKGKTDYLTDASKLKLALIDYENLVEKSESSNPLIYLYYARSLDSNDKKIEAKINGLSHRLTKVENEIEFFSINISKIDKSCQAKFLADKDLSSFHYFLTQKWLSGEHYLSEAEEKIMNLKSLPASSMWRRATTKAENKLLIKYGSKFISVGEAANRAPELPTKQRHALHKAIMEKLFTISDQAEAEINAIFTDKKINDELRHFTYPYSSTLLRNENDEKTIQHLVKTVTDAFPIAHRFHTLKAKLLGLKKLEYSDRGAKIGHIKKKYTFPQAVDILTTSFGNLDPLYADILRSMLDGGQIDVYPKKGKDSGAYCSTTVSNPTVVLLNHVDSLQSTLTFGHEMGHAIHGQLSKSNRVLYQGYSTSVAETASTFFEDIVFENVKSKLSAKDQINLLHDRINDDISTIFRQMAVFNFELELHTQVRKTGYVAKEEIASLMNKHMSAYLGPKFTLSKLDGYFFVFWPHIRNYFYVYTYAFGRLVSRALFHKLKADPTFASKIKSFLSAGSSMSPEDIFKSIGIDITNPDFFASGLKSIEEQIIELEKLTS